MSDFLDRLQKLMDDHFTALDAPRPLNESMLETLHEFALMFSEHPDFTVTVEFQKTHDKNQVILLEKPKNFPESHGRDLFKFNMNPKQDGSWSNEPFDGTIGRSITTREALEDFIIGQMAKPYFWHLRFKQESK